MKKILLYIFLVLLLLNTCCSYRYLQKPIGTFADANVLIGKNTVYVFEQLQEEEILVRIAESVKKDSIEPSDLEPRVLTTEHLETRKELIDYLVKYTELLHSLIDEDYNKDILNNNKRVNESIEKISSRHNDTFSREEVGIISAIGAALPEALTAARNRRLILKLMNRHQPLIDKISGMLKEELQLTKKVINTFFARQFRLVTAEKWPDKESKRESYAKKGAKILDRKRKINVILDDLIAAIGIISPTHKRLMGYVKNNRGPLNTLSSFVDYAARIEGLYLEYSEEKKGNK
ncbi:MAG: hypothetical protein KAW12_26940 [Candidatus Aminicenantes bacterium]|nr:hypothetical protein [Candidatus Aminicenantes bacterium]